MLQEVSGRHGKCNLRKEDVGMFVVGLITRRSCVPIARRLPEIGLELKSCGSEVSVLFSLARNTVIQFEMDAIVCVSQQVPMEPYGASYGLVVCSASVARN